MQERMADPQIGPDPSAGSSPAFIRARLALASSYVKNTFTSRFLFAIQIPLSIRSSHIKQKRIASLRFHHLLVEQKGRLVLRWGREAKVRYPQVAVVRREFLLARHALTRDFCS